MPIYVDRSGGTVLYSLYFSWADPDAPALPSLDRVAEILRKARIPGATLLPAAGFWFDGSAPRSGGWERSAVLQVYGADPAAVRRLADALREAFDQTEVHVVSVGSTLEVHAA